MKKKIFCLILVLLVSVIAFSQSVYAEESNNQAPNEVLKNESTSKIIELKEKDLNSLEDYTITYGSESYGMAAFILNKVRLYSIPLCFVGIAISAIYQYVIGVRKLDVRDKGFNIMIAIITVFVICQVLPLIFYKWCHHFYF